MKKTKKMRRFTEKQIAWLKRDELALIRGAVLLKRARYAPNSLRLRLQKNPRASEDKEKYLRCWEKEG